MRWEAQEEVALGVQEGQGVTSTQCIGVDKEAAPIMVDSTRAGILILTRALGIISTTKEVATLDSKVRLLIKYKMDQNESGLFSMF